MAVDEVALSRTVSHALRHDPGAYGIELDDQGWVDVERLVTALRSADPAWAELSAADLERALASIPKRRHEITQGRIRAIYGHSAGDVRYEAVEPPPTLFHGTTATAAERILEVGLLPAPRLYVHLAPDVDTARRVGRRRDRRPVVLEVQAQAAHRDGVPFFRAGDAVWLAHEVPPRFIRRVR